MIASREVVVEDDELGADLRDLQQDLVAQGDVCEDDDLAVEALRIEGVFVTAGDVAGVVAPRAPGRPRSSETVGAPRVEDQVPLHAAQGSPSTIGRVGLGVSAGSGSLEFAAAAAVAFALLGDLRVFHLPGATACAARVLSFRR